MAFEHLFLVVGEAFVGIGFIVFEGFRGLLFGVLERFSSLGFLSLHLPVEERSLSGVALVGCGQLCLEGLFFCREGVFAASGDEYAGKDACCEGYDGDDDCCYHR